MNFLENKSIINKEQFGFRRGLNTFTALNSLNEEIYTALDKHNSLLSIFINFTKAFDTVKHDILLQKLKHYGIRGIIHDWFQDYIQNRTQSVKNLNHISSPHLIQYTVPQGSVLGPLLFIIYVNDITHIFNKLKNNTICR